MKLLNIKRYARRVSSFQWFVIIAVVCNIILYVLLTYRRRRLEPHKGYTEKQYDQLLFNKALSNKEPGLTVVIYEFEFFDNRILETVEHTHSIYPLADIVVYSSTNPYPPIILPHYAKLFIAKVPLEKTEITNRLELFIKKEFVLIVPDAHQIISEDSVRWMMSELELLPADVKMLAWPANANRNVQCLNLQVHLKKWTLKYSHSKDLCDALTGNFFLLIKRKHLLSLAKPFMRPQSDAFFIQTALRGWKIKYRDDFTFRKLVKLFQDPHLNWKHRNKEQHRLSNLYKDFGIKLVHTSDNREQWLGCTKESQRCFGSVINNMPEYIYQGRWTPPCCLNALRVTARHVFAVLDNQGVRYWLEGGSLLGAVRYADIIPWDYDIDIGIYQDDIPKCMHLLKCDFQPFEDQDGFVWERATEGDFFRVQYSSSNRLHVDIFPFYSQNGTMTKKTWFKTHRQDREFPEHYLNPLEQIPFIGTKAYAPNNYRDFLEFKFGKGVIENEKYPDASDAT